jgi:hypothetical protein
MPKKLFGHNLRSPTSSVVIGNPRSGASAKMCPSKFEAATVAADDVEGQLAAGGWGEGRRTEVYL